MERGGQGGGTSSAAGDDGDHTLHAEERGGVEVVGAVGSHFEVFACASLAYRNCGKTGKAGEIKKLKTDSGARVTNVVRRSYGAFQ